MKKETALWALLLIASFLASVVALKNREPNIVFRTYSLAAERMTQQEQGLYPETKPKGTDVYKYSPAFAMAFIPLREQNKSNQLAWAFVNFIVFWLGVWALYQSTWAASQRSFWVFWVLAALASMELNGAILYEQSNALIVGLLMLAVALFEKNKKGTSALLFALATWIKLFPIAIWAPFVIHQALKKEKAFLLSSVLSLVALFLVPALFRGWGQNFEDHVLWAQLISGDLSRTGMLDFRSFWIRLGASFFWAQSLWLLCAMLAVYLTLKNINKIASPLWLGFAVCAMTALNSSTESPSFVFLAPAYLGVLYFNKQNKLAIGTAILGFLITTWVYTDFSAFIEWPKILNSIYTYKVAGLHLFFVLYTALLFKSGHRLCWRVKDSD